MMTSLTVWIVYLYPMHFTLEQISCIPPVSTGPVFMNMYDIRQAQVIAQHS